MIAAPSHRPTPTPLPVAVGVLATSLAKVMAWFVPILIAVPVVLYTLVHLLGGELHGSDVTMGVAINAPAWFLFAMGASLMTQHLPVHVAHGMTRRSLAAALGWTTIAAAALLSLMVPVGLVVEVGVMDAYGWTRDTEGPLATSFASVGFVVVEAFLRFVAMASLGVLAAIAYYRGGPWWGSLVALATVGAPGVAVIYLFGERGAWIAPTARVALAVALIVLVTAAYHALIRGATIRGKGA